MMNLLSIFWNGIYSNVDVAASTAIGVVVAVVVVVVAIHAVVAVVVVAGVVAVAAAQWQPASSFPVLLRIPSYFFRETMLPVLPDDRCQKRFVAMSWTHLMRLTSNSLRPVWQRRRLLLQLRGTETSVSSRTSWVPGVPDEEEANILAIRSLQISLTAQNFFTRPKNGASDTALPSLWLPTYQHLKC